MPHVPISTTVQVPTVFNSATNLGVRPTVGGTEHRFETHLLDFPEAGGSDDLYGQMVTVEFVARLRGEHKFNGFAELVAQIHTDIAQARALLPTPVSVSQPFFLQTPLKAIHAYSLRLCPTSWSSGLGRLPCHCGGVGATGA